MSHKITYRERGQGPVVILLHGYGGSVGHWDQVAENLKDSFRVVVPNLTHIYLSSEKISFNQQVEYLADFIRLHFANEKVSLVGLSYGGALCWATLLAHPELFEKGVFINPMIADPVKEFSLPELRYFFAVPLSLNMTYFLLSTPVGRTFLKRAAQLFRDERSGGAIGVENLKGRKLMFVAHMIHHFAWILKSADWNYWLHKMSNSVVESLLIYDREDLLLDSNSYKKFSNVFHCEKVIEMTGAGHIAIKARPETIAKYISDYLKNAADKKENISA